MNMNEHKYLSAWLVGYFVCWYPLVAYLKHPLAFSFFMGIVGIIGAILILVSFKK